MESKERMTPISLVVILIHLSYSKHFEQLCHLKIIDRATHCGTKHRFSYIILFIYTSAHQYKISTLHDIRKIQVASIATDGLITNIAILSNLLIIFYSKLMYLFFKCIT